MGMDNVQRAKQFLPFAALKGFEKAIAERETEREERIILGEDAQAELDLKLQRLKRGDIVSIRHYSAQRYEDALGQVKKIDLFQRQLLLGETRIAFDDIFDVGGTET